MHSLTTAVRPPLAKACLGADDSIWHALTSSRILVPLVQADARERIWELYDKPSLDEIVQKISLLPKYTGKENHHVEFHVAALRVRCPLSVTLKLFVEGKFKTAIRNVEYKGFKSVRILVDELKSLTKPGG